MSQSPRQRTEKDIMDQRPGFSGAYLAAQHLRQEIRTRPDQATDQTVGALLFLIRSPRFDRKKQVFFLFKEAADALIELALTTPFKSGIINALQETLLTSEGMRIKAVADALGGLPVVFSMPEKAASHFETPCSITLEQLIRAFPHPVTAPSYWKGRSLVFPLARGYLGVVKFANSQENVAELAGETFWQRTLGDLYRSDSWQIPIPLFPETSGVFRIETDRIPSSPPSLYEGLCIAYTAHASYFEYPNEAWAAPIPWPGICRIFFDTAGQLANLAARGIYHTALIPLFHNRVQQGRRNDNGAYLWEHGGRLDQWLDSCRYPNFSLAGLRDFEHIVQEADSAHLGHYIGEHMLSFILVAGSYFRSQDPKRRGLAPDGTPWDTRDLFDASGFTKLVTGICRAYFMGLSGSPLPRILEQKIAMLVPELIRVMGEDRDMEEVLRVQDQNDMDQKAYELFLSVRGVSPFPPKGDEDIVMMTGPHLGGFNQPISVRPLVDFLFAFSALCVSEAFALTHLDTVSGMDQVAV